MARPLLFLDIDGVLNLLGRPRALPSGRGSVLSPVERASEKVTKLAAAFEVVWASQWRARAPLVWGKELGIGADWPYLPYGVDKLEAILRYAGDRPWAWVDDNAQPCDSGFVLRPDPLVGITDEDVEALCGHTFSSAAAQS